MGLAGSLSRPSSPRADLFRLRSQELMAGWLRAFCRSPTFWPSSVLTLSTLRFFKGSGGQGRRDRVMKGPSFRTKGRPGRAVLPQGVSRGEMWQNQPGGLTWGPLWGAFGSVA